MKVGSIANHTSTDAILQALLRGDKLTHAQAMAYGTYRLSAVIHRLRERGHYITSTMRRDVNGKSYAVYQMVAPSPFEG